jgi:hypothetical protein
MTYLFRMEASVLGFFQKQSDQVTNPKVWRPNAVIPDDNRIALIDDFFVACACISLTG